ncbi:unnamed protein product, partial [Ceratitis capitata]
VTHGHKPKSQEMFSKMLESISQRNEEEEKYREASLKETKDIADAINNNTSAMLALAQSNRK